MEPTVKKVRIFVASPNDVTEEREALATVINEINHTISALAPEKNVLLELVRWETHAHPKMGRIQNIINEQIGKYDVFIGIMWKRFGTPTSVAESGTEEEFDRAFREWTKDKSRPILFYFCQEPFPPPTTVVEVEQLLKVVEFREKLSGRGLTWDYGSHSEFPSMIRLHLVKELGEMLNPGASRANHAKRIGFAALEDATSTVKSQRPGPSPRARVRSGSCSNGIRSYSYSANGGDYEPNEVTVLSCISAGWRASNERVSG